MLVEYGPAALVDGPGKEGGQGKGAFASLQPGMGGGGIINLKQDMRSRNAQKGCGVRALQSADGARATSRPPRV